MSTDGYEAALASAARGDEAAIATLYRLLNPLLLRYLRHNVGPVAEDVAADVWLALARQLTGSPAPSTICAVDVHRRAAPRRRPLPVERTP